MADVEHKSLTDPEIHEPLGVKTATTGTVYVADSGTSGDWILPEPKGIASESSNKVYYSDGSGSGTWRELAHAQFHSETSQNITATSVPFQDVNFEDTNHNSGLTHSDTVDPHQVVIIDSGEYSITFVLSLDTSTGSNITFEGLIKINGTEIKGSAASVILESATDQKQLVSTAIATVSSGDIITIGVAVSSTSGTPKLNYTGTLATGKVSASISIMEIG